MHNITTISSETKWARVKLYEMEAVDYQNISGEGRLGGQGWLSNSVVSRRARVSVFSISKSRKFVCMCEFIRVYCVNGRRHILILDPKG